MTSADKGTASQDYASRFEVLFASAGLNDFGLSASNITAYVLNRHLKTLAGINFRFTCEAGVPLRQVPSAEVGGEFSEAQPEALLRWRCLSAIAR